MSTGGGKQHKQYEAQRVAEQKRYNDLVEKQQQPTPEQQRFRQGSADWQQFVEGKDYRTPPSNSILNFDLFTPAHRQQQRERMSDLEGIGAASMDGNASSSIPLQLARERNANIAGQEAARSYENAIKAEDTYYKTGALPYAQMEIGKLNSLLGQTANREAHYGNLAYQTRKRSLFPAILGGAVSAGGSLLSNPALKI